MKGEGTYDVVIIGAGTAGLVTAAGTAGLGGRVALIERHKMGGDCLNFGCVPSKALISSARLIAHIRQAEKWGLEKQEPQFRFEQVFARMRQVRAAIAPNDSQERFESLGVDVFRGEAHFVGPHEVEVEGKKLRGAHIVIASGSRATVPEIAGLDLIPHYTNETIFDGLVEKPGRLAVVGGGPIGCELAQVFARLGVAVTIVQRAARLLPREDKEAGEVLLEQFREEGIQVIFGATVARCSLRGGERVLELKGGGGEIQADALLLAAGRKPNLRSLNLEAAKVAWTEKGLVLNRCLQTSQPHIYAAGDVAGTYQFTHTADFQARLVIRNILMPFQWLRRKKDDTVVPWVTYTSPEIARVGLNEVEAKERGIPCAIYKVPMQEVDRAVLENEPIGFTQVLTARGSDRILGATIVGERAGELIHEVALAMRGGIGLGTIAATIHAYPTFSEAIRKAGDRYNRGRLTPRAKRIFEWLFRRSRRKSS